MIFFHLSDLHIGLRLHNRDLGEDQRYIFHQIAEEAARVKPDAVVIAGDIYDRAVPSADAVDLFDGFVMELRSAAPDAEIMMISGNHDSAPRVNVFRKVLAGAKIRMIGKPPILPEEHIEKVVLRDSFGPVNFYLLPFVKPSAVRLITGTEDDGTPLTYDEAVRRLIARENIRGEERNVLVSHQFYLPAGKKAEDIERMDSEIRTVGNIDEVGADVLSPFDYAALGHIHKPMKAGADCYRYCGTPLACSVSEAGQEKGIVLVEMGEKGHTSVSVIPLRPMREIRVIEGDLEAVLEKATDDYVQVRLTDKADLDVIDMQERLRLAFPNLLEVRRETLRGADYSAEVQAREDPDPFGMCRAFLGDLDAEETELLRSVVTAATEAGGE